MPRAPSRRCLGEAALQQVICIIKNKFGLEAANGLQAGAPAYLTQAHVNVLAHAHASLPWAGEALCIVHVGLVLGC